MAKPKQSTVQAIFDAYRAAGTWRRLAVEIGMAESDAAMLCYVARTNRNVSRETENKIRQALGLGPVPARRRNSRVDVACNSDELARIMAMTPRQRAEAMLNTQEGEMIDEIIERLQEGAQTAEDVGKLSEMFPFLSTRLCPHCGNSNFGDSVYSCPQCGYEYDADESIEPFVLASMMCDGGSYHDVVMPKLLGFIFSRLLRRQC